MPIIIRASEPPMRENERLSPLGFVHTLYFASSSEAGFGVIWQECLLSSSHHMIVRISYNPRASSLQVRPLTSGQIRSARALIRWRAEDLARECSVGIATIRRAELATEKTSLTAANDLAIRRAFEAAGIEFIEENGGGPGLQLRERGSRRSSRRFPAVTS